MLTHVACEGKVKLQLDITLKLRLRVVEVEHVVEQPVEHAKSAPISPRSGC
jgi:hypothetical protein